MAGVLIGPTTTTITTLSLFFSHTHSSCILFFALHFCTSSGLHHITSVSVLRSCSSHSSTTSSDSHHFVCFLSPSGYQHAPTQSRTPHAQALTTQGNAIQTVAKGAGEPTQPSTSRVTEYLNTHTSHITYTRKEHSSG